MILQINNNFAGELFKKHFNNDINKTRQHLKSYFIMHFVFLY